LQPFHQGSQPFFQGSQQEKKPIAEKEPIAVLAEKFWEGSKCLSDALAPKTESFCHFFSQGPEPFR